MQIKTQLLIEDTLKLLAVVAFVGAWLYVAEPVEDSDKDTDFPKQTNTIEVHIKQLNGINHVVYRECVLLGNRVECL
jgi:hypothetical protein